MSGAVGLVFEPFGGACEWGADFVENAGGLLEVSIDEIVVVWECVAECLFEVFDGVSVMWFEGDGFV